jgi:hypothetical protein
MRRALYRMARWTIYAVGRKWTPERRLSLLGHVSRVLYPELGPFSKIKTA